ncbi:MAG: HAD family hydrolase [Promethearchaeota archaeon]
MFHEYGVIFDMDGVLVDTGPIHFESWVKMANEIGKKFTKDFFNQTFGEQSVPITRKLVGSKIEQHLVEKWANLKEQYFREMIKDKLHPLPGVLDLIKDLKTNNFKMAVGSSGPPENVELTLTSLKIKEFFDVVISAAEVEKSKPEPDVFLIAAEKLGINPENCVVIEDAPVGITAGKRAGMKVIALRTTHCNMELLGADLVVPNLSFIKLNDIIKILDLDVE